MLMICDRNYYPLPGTADDNNSGGDVLFGECESRGVTNECVDVSVSNYSVDRNNDTTRPQGSDHRA